MNKVQKSFQAKLEERVKEIEKNLAHMKTEGLNYTYSNLSSQLRRILEEKGYEIEVGVQYDRIYAKDVD